MKVSPKQYQFLQGTRKNYITSLKQKYGTQTDMVISTTTIKTTETVTVPKWDYDNLLENTKLLELIADDLNISLDEYAEALEND